MRIKIRKKPPMKEIKDLIKAACAGAISISVGSIINNLSEYYVPKNIKRISKIGLGLSTFIITNVVTNKLTAKVEDNIDSVIETE